MVIVLILIMLPLILFDLLSRVSMVKKVVCAIQRHGINTQMMQQLQCLFETSKEIHSTFKSTETLQSEFTAHTSRVQPTMKINWGKKLFVAMIFANISHMILLAIMEILFLNLLQISIGESFLFAESQIFPRFVVCQVPEENIGFSNAISYNCAIPSNVLVERLIYVTAFWVTISIIWNVICLFHMLHKARKTLRQLMWKLYSVIAANDVSGSQKHDDFINYMSLNGHLVLLIFQSNLVTDDFHSFYATLFNEFKTNAFLSTSDNNELQILT